MGRMNRSSLTGLRVNPSPTNVALLTIRFHDFDLCLPVLMTLNISASAIPRTLGRGTEYLAARSFLRSLMAVDSALASYPVSLRIPLRQKSDCRWTHLLTLSIKQVGGESTVLNSSIILLLDIPLVVRFELLLHLNLFRVSFSMVQFCFMTKHLLSICGCLVGFSGCTLSPGCVSSGRHTVGKPAHFRSS